MTDPHTSSTGNDRRGFLGGAVAGIVGGALVAAASSQAEGQTPGRSTRAGLVPKGAPAADAGYTPGIVAQGQRIVFVSGQGPEDLKADMETQIRQTFQRIGMVLAEAGATFKDVVMIRSYFVSMKRDLPILRKVRKEFLEKPYPASTAVGTTELAIPGLEIEIEAVAVL
jgi:enamine deaminase RidA (YjgF/YER057c/UK114 family)